MEACSYAIPKEGYLMEKTGFKVYGYRWVMLLVFMLIVAVTN